MAIISISALPLLKFGVVSITSVLLVESIILGLIASIY